MALSPPRHLITCTTLTLWLMLLCTDLANADTKTSGRMNFPLQPNLSQGDEFDGCYKNDCRRSDTYNEDMLDNNIEFVLNPRYAHKMAHSEKSADLLRDIFIHTPFKYLQYRAWNSDAKDLIEKQTAMPNEESNTVQVMRNGEKRNNGVNRVSQYSQADNSRYCSCDEKSKQIDLGVGHFPRYLMMSDCVPLARWPYQCRPKTFKVSVLKHREAGEEKEIGAPRLPPALRNDWIFHDVDLPVACECMP